VSQHSGIRCGAWHNKGLRVIRFSARRPDNQPDEDSELLHTLLHQHEPPERDPLRPVALRSREEQRRHAFRAFRLRTWLDYALEHAERLLLLLVVGFFVFWLLNGYGRDWLYYQTHPEAMRGGIDPAVFAATDDAAPVWDTGTLSNTATLSATDALSATGTLSRTAVISGPALPFVPPGLTEAITATGALTSTPAAPPRSTPDYMAPAPVPIVPLAADQRPQRLLIPRLDLSTPVKEVYIQDGVWQVAEYAAGYHHGSALPGEDGNVVMAGHAGLRGAIFRSLGTLRPGDDVFVDAGGWRYRYQVREQMSVWPTQVAVMEPTPTPVLTLITCTAWDTKRLVVIADLVDSRPLEGNVGE
jgi:sortase A